METRRLIARVFQSGVSPAALCMLVRLRVAQHVRFSYVTELERIMRNLYLVECEWLGSLDCCDSYN